MKLEDFIAIHEPVLRADALRFNLLLARMATALADRERPVQFWDLGAAGHCAIRLPPGGIVLGMLDAQRCARLAEATRAIDYPSVFGVEDVPAQFVAAASALGIVFGAPLAMRTLALRSPPWHPGAEGSARRAKSKDAALLCEWLSAFRAEATPREPLPTPDDAWRSAQSGRYWLWTVQGEPVAMAAVVRDLGPTIFVGGVYTPLPLRGRGYAGAVTAALCDHAFREGKSAVGLFADRTNPASNRAYEKIGFKPYCEAWDFPRLDSRGPSATD